MKNLFNFLVGAKKVIPFIRAFAELLDRVVEPIDQFSDKIKELNDKGASK